MIRPYPGATTCSTSRTDAPSIVWLRGMPRACPGPRQAADPLRRPWRSRQAARLPASSRAGCRQQSWDQRLEHLHTSWTSRPTPVDLIWRFAYRLGFPLARIWWRLRRSGHEGALVAIHVDDRLLLLRSSYRRTWNLPGGGVRPGEAPEQAARRELLEEIGIPAPVLTAVGIFSGICDGRQDRVHIFELRLDTLSELTLDNREIIAAQLMQPSDIAVIEVTAPVAAYLDGRIALPDGHGTLGDASRVARSQVETLS